MHEPVLSIFYFIIKMILVHIGRLQEVFPFEQGLFEKHHLCVFGGDVEGWFLLFKSRILNPSTL
jgi:hypothetical protein